MGSTRVHTMAEHVRLPGSYQLLPLALCWAYTSGTRGVTPQLWTLTAADCRLSPALITPPPPLLVLVPDRWCASPWSPALPTLCNSRVVQGDTQARHAMLEPAEADHAVSLPSPNKHRHSLAFPEGRCFAASCMASTGLVQVEQLINRLVYNARVLWQADEC